MQSTSCWRNFGDVDAAMVWDGTLAAELKTILNLAPAEAEALIAAERNTTGHDPLILPVRAFLFRLPNRLVLIDTGSGTSKGPTMGHLPASLAALGVAAVDIDTVLLTHLHMDHIGGLVDATGHAAFRNAELVLHNAEARYFLDKPEVDIDARSRRHLATQRAIVGAYAGRIRRVGDGRVEGLPGVSAQPAPGHTPGHTAWEIDAGAERVVVIGDVVHMAAVQLPRPLTPMIYDVDPIRAGLTRCALLDRIARDGAIVAGAHLGADGFGRIDKRGDAYAFRPLAT